MYCSVIFLRTYVKKLLSKLVASFSRLRQYSVRPFVYLELCELNAGDGFYCGWKLYSIGLKTIVESVLHVALCGIRKTLFSSANFVCQ